MMFRDIVESVMLLNEDDCRSEQKEKGEDEIKSEGMCEADFPSGVFATSCPLTLSMLEAFGFRRRRRCRLMRREELCSVELLNLKRAAECNISKARTPNGSAVI